MNFRRIRAVSRLVLLFGTPVAIVVGLFSCGVHYGSSNQARIARFERDWLGIEVTVHDDADAGSTHEGKSKGDEDTAGEDTEAEAKESAGISAPTEPVTDKPAPAEREPDKPAEPVPVKPVTDKPSEPDSPESEDIHPSEVESEAVPRPSASSASEPGALPPPEKSIPSYLQPLPLSEVDELDDPKDRRLFAGERVIRVKVVVDESWASSFPRWLDLVQHTIEQASIVYEDEFGIRLSLVAVARWKGAGDDAEAAMEALKSLPLEEADILLAMTGRALSSDIVGPIARLDDDAPNNQCFALVYPMVAQPSPYIRSTLRAVAELMGATPTDQNRSWMSATVVDPEDPPWIDPANRRRILSRKDLGFVPKLSDAEPSPQQIAGEDSP